MQLLGGLTRRRNKDLVRRLVEEIHDEYVDEIDDVLAVDYVQHGPVPGDEIRDRGGFRRYVMKMHEAFPDFRYDIEEFVAEGNTVVARVTFTGTHEGPYRGVAPTGKRLRTTGTITCHVADGRVSEAWYHVDLLSIMRQLGVVEETTLRLE